MRVLDLSLLCFTVLLGYVASAQSEHAPLLKGDQAYDKEQYKEAEKHYRIAADRNNGDAQAVYNLANALYQQGNFEDAGQRFEQASKAAKMPAQTADALHNLGNALLKQHKFKEAIQAYEESLRQRPGDPATKMNLQLARKKHREEQEKEQKEKNQQQQDQNKDQPQDQNSQNQPDQKKNQPGQSRPNQPGESQQPPDEKQKKVEEQKLKKEEAKHLLETAIEPEDRKNARKYRATQQQTKPKGSKKDW